MKVLLLDIENAPLKAYVWSKYVDGAIIDMISEWYMLCWCAKWLDGKRMMSDAIWNYKEYDKDSEYDYPIALSLRKLIDQADVVVAHNGDRFDLRKINAKCCEHGIDPPSPYHTLDTLKIARKHFMFTSNKLDDLGRLLGVGRKLRTGGFDLWKDVMDGDAKAQSQMLRYCMQDVVLLEDVYKKLRAWHSGPSIAETGKMQCPKCGGENVIKDGFYKTQKNLTKYQQFRCNDCGGWMRGTVNLMDKEEKSNVLVGV